MSAPNVVFIVGVGRSGTSLLQSMLNANPEICFPPETGFLRTWLAGGALEQRHRKGGRTAVLDALRDDQITTRLDISAHQLEALVQTRPSFDASLLYLDILKTYARARGDAMLLGDKDPRCVEYLRLLHRHFPHAHVLHLIRDPRDVLASKKNAAWSRDGSALRHIFAGRVQLDMGRRHGPMLFGGRYQELIYEELVAGPARVLERVCAGLGVSFSPAMLTFQESSKELVTAEELQWKQKTLGPLLSTPTRAWQDSLRGWEVALVERLCRQAFEVGGYPREPSDGLVHYLAAASTPVFDVADRLYRLHRRWQLR